MRHGCVFAELNGSLWLWKSR